MSSNSPSQSPSLQSPRNREHSPAPSDPHSLDTHKEKEKRMEKEKEKEKGRKQKEKGSKKSKAKDKGKEKSNKPIPSHDASTTLEHSSQVAGEFQRLQGQMAPRGREPSKAADKGRNPRKRSDEELSEIDGQISDEELYKSGDFFSPQHHRQNGNDNDNDDDEGQLLDFGDPLPILFSPSYKDRHLTEDAYHEESREYTRDALLRQSEDLYHHNKNLQLDNSALLDRSFRLEEEQSFLKKWFFYAKKLGLVVFVIAVLYFLLAYRQFTYCKPGEAVAAGLCQPCPLGYVCSRWKITGCKREENAPDTPVHMTPDGLCVSMTANDEWKDELKIARKQVEILRLKAYGYNVHGKKDHVVTQHPEYDDLDEVDPRKIRRSDLEEYVRLYDLCQDKYLLARLRARRVLNDNRKLLKIEKTTDEKSGESSWFSYEFDRAKKSLAHRTFYRVKATFWDRSLNQKWQDLPHR